MPIELSLPQIWVENPDDFDRAKIYAQKLMEQWKIPITVVSGPVTDNQTGTDYIVRELKLPAANAKTDGRALFGIVYEEIHK